MNYQRRLDVQELLHLKSLLLLGPRQTGKTTLARSLGLEIPIVDLAEANTFRELSAHPELLRQRLSPQTTRLVIDETQRLPELLDEVQVLLDRNKELRILLTGSSARKLKRAGLNLLPGRIWRRFIHPMISKELGSARIVERVKRGSLPGIIDSEYYREELRNYVGLYLEEEIRSEGLTRNVGSFSRFLTVAGLCNAQQINYSNVSNDTGVSFNTVRAYFQILYDTLIQMKKTKESKHFFSRYALSQNLGFIEAVKFILHR